MKKGIVYILAAASLAASLAACGTAGMPDTSASPMPSGSPMTAAPDMNDGIVRDDDGIITDDDTGTVPTQTPMTGASAKPSASANPGTDTGKE